MLFWTDTEITCEGIVKAIYAEEEFTAILLTTGSIFFLTDDDLATNMVIVEPD